MTLLRATSDAEVNIHYHIPYRAGFISTFDGVVWIMFFFLLGRPWGFHKINPCMSIFYFTIWRICLDHHSLHRYALNNIKILNCLQWATIYAFKIQKREKARKERKTIKIDLISLTPNVKVWRKSLKSIGSNQRRAFTYKNITEWKKFITLFCTACKGVSNPTAEPKQICDWVQSTSKIALD